MTSISKPMTKAIAVTLIHVAIVCSLGAKLLYDRKTRPQAWFKAEMFDPDLPIRGRYVSLQVHVNDSRSPEEVQKRFERELLVMDERSQKYPSISRSIEFGAECGYLEVRDGVPVPVFDRDSSNQAQNGETFGYTGWPCDNLSFQRRKTATAITLRVTNPIVFFIPERASDPTRVPKGYELWVLATIPRKGPPRPIALATQKEGGTTFNPHLD